MEKALKFLKEQEKACNAYMGAFTEQDLIDYEGDDEVEAVKKYLIEAKEAIAELEAMKPKTCYGCDNNHKDRTIFYDCKKALMCTFCKYGAVSYFKQKDNA